MTVPHIQQALLNRFDNHTYELLNAYIYYDWECDFFSITKSGYAYEIEVKLSRGDFKKDFDKWKHKMFPRSQVLHEIILIKKYNYGKCKSN